MGELDKTIAVVFKRGGKNVMSEMEFVNNVIFNFRYSGTKEGFKLDARKAQQVMDAGLAKGLLKKEEGMVKPTFDYREFEVPMNYKPTEAILSELITEGTPTSSSGPDVPATTTPAAIAVQPEMGPTLLPTQAPPKSATPAVPQSLFARLVDEISKVSGLKRNDVVARINKVQEKLGTESIVAALAVARDNGIDITKYLKEAKEEIVKS
ncbi:MAG TPA: DUF2240 family protein [Methanomassiliicoccales archaeon]|jgi:hypothetical protein